MKKILICLIAIFTILIGTTPINADQPETNEFEYNNFHVVETIYNGYKTLEATNSDGDKLYMRSDRNYYMLNDDIVYYSISDEIVSYYSESDIVRMHNDYVNNPTASSPTYVKVHTSTMTYQQSKAISQLVADILGLAMGWKLGLAYAVYNSIINYYKVPSLAESKIVYVRTDKYAYVPVLSTFYHHDYALDVNYNKVANTDNFDNYGLKAYLGY